MKYTFFLTVVFLRSFLAVQAQTSEPQAIPGEYIITLKETAVKPLIHDLPTPAADDNRKTRFAQSDAQRQQKLTQVRALWADAGISSDNILFEWVDATVAFAAKLNNQQLEMLKNNPLVEQVDPNYAFQLQLPEETPNEMDNALAQTTPCAITNAGGFLDAATKLTYIWILDTGIDLDHPDLNVVTDPDYAKSFITGQTTDDLNGHGTHVAGIAGAKNNGIGTVGISAGAKLVPLKVLSNTGGGSSIGIISALNHVAQMYYVNDVVNMSFSASVSYNCENSSIAYRNAIRNLGLKGVWVCIAAGNSSCDASKARPACINGEHIFTVGSMTCQLKCANTSNWSKNVIDWVATGDRVYSTYKNGTYKTLSGTSMATPVVAGICHSAVGAPLVAGTITCGNACVPAFTYKIAKR